MDARVHAMDKAVLKLDVDGVIELQKITTETSLKMRVANFHIYFKLNGEELRMDYHMSLDEPVPRVADIRNFLWQSANDYQSLLK